MMLLRPFHVHNVNSPEEYKALQAAVIAQGRRLKPRLPWRDPWICLAPSQVYVAMGRWMLRCVCGGCCSVDPDWRLACCLACGAIFEHVEIPEAADEIEAVLLHRPNIYNQAWVPTETIEDLRSENRAHSLSDRPMPPHPSEDGHGLG